MSQPRRRGHAAEAIQEAAADLFYQHGYEATSLRQIAAKVGLQVGSLYNHIGGKDELLRNIMVTIVDEHLTALKDAVAGHEDTADALSAAIETHLRFHAERARNVFLGNSELRSLAPEDRQRVVAKRDEYENVLSQLIQRLADEGSGNVIDVRLQTYAIVALGTHVSIWYRPNGDLSLDDLVSTYTTLVFRQLGLRPPKLG